MTPERWQQIDNLLEQALEQEPDRRTSFLDQVCAGDDELRKELEELLAAHEQSGGRLSSAPMKVAPGRLDPPNSLIGQDLSHYKILSFLGQGGMGVVYKARDILLERHVAIKVLPSQLLADKERKRRFVQEAKAASALNHPNIVTIYEIASDHGMDFIVMEYVTGKTLDHLIPRKGMPLKEALKIAVPMADALASAHAAGIVHRDFKPSNVMVGENGQVKVLDFGLAKLIEKDCEQAVDTRSEASESCPRTEEGVLLGTVSYMSPEQAEGKQVNGRSDIFSFGSVLYEMVTARRAFQGNSTMSTLAAILNHEPKPVREIVGTLPHDLEKIINRCLRKDPQRRFQYMADVKVTLQEVLEEATSGELPRVVGPAHSNTRRVNLVGGLFACLVAFALTVWVWHPFRDSGEAHLKATPLTTYPGHERFPTFSPDGNQVAFSWNGARQDNYDIYVKQIGVEQPPSRLTQNAEDDVSPAWSPDGQTIAFLRPLSLTSVALILIPQRGGTERTLAELDFSKELLGKDLVGPYLAWTPDSKWIVSPVAESGRRAYALFLFSTETAERRKLTKPPIGIGDTTPSFSPDGRSLSFARFSVGQSEIRLLRLTSEYQPDGEPELSLFESPCNAGGVAWMSNGKEIVGVSGAVTGKRLWPGHFTPGEPFGLFCGMA